MRKFFDDACIHGEARGAQIRRSQPATILVSPAGTFWLRRMKFTTETEINLSTSFSTDGVTMYSTIIVSIAWNSAAVIGNLYSIDSTWTFFVFMST